MSIVQYKEHDKLLIAIDCIIFGFDGKNLKALFIKRGFEPGKNKWSLMGGFVKKTESVDAAAARILNELTGLSNIYMEQLYCFGAVDRDPASRVVSVAYFALINIKDYPEHLMQLYHAHWYDLGKAPALVFDHNNMLQLARERLQQKVANHPIGFALLPNKFTMQQLQSLYEAIYETPLDKRNFTRKILAMGVLSKLNEKEKTSSKKGAFYFTFDKTKYKKLESEGLRFV
jgi:ADP-ribose pyrophosphatase YjhB (NUDIX family)